MRPVNGHRLLAIPSLRGQSSAFPEHKEAADIHSRDQPVGRAEMASAANTGSDKTLVKSMVRKCNLAPESFQHI